MSETSLSATNELQKTCLVLRLEGEGTEIHPSVPLELTLDIMSHLLLYET